MQGAITQFEAALRIDPKNTIAHYNLAVLWANQNKSAQAITHLQSVLSVDPNDLSARLLLGQQLSQSGRLEEALAAFSAVVQADPDNEDALLEQTPATKTSVRNSIGQFGSGLCSIPATRPDDSVAGLSAGRVAATQST
jgi:cytochrome c-type biogenesis protein CcmH/NrfG